MVKSKSEETKEYKILLETCVPLHPQEQVCSSALLPNRLMFWPRLKVYGFFWGGGRPGDPAARLPWQLVAAPGLASPSPAAFPFPLPPSHPLLHLPRLTWPSGEPVQLTKPSGKLCFGFDWLGEPSWDPTSTGAGARKAGEGHSQGWGMGSKEQSQSWYSRFSIQTTLNSSVLMTQWEFCRNRLQMITPWPQKDVAEPKSYKRTEGQERTTACLPSLVFDCRGPSSYWWAVFKLICWIPELLLWW